MRELVVRGGACCLPQSPGRGRRGGEEADGCVVRKRWTTSQTTAALFDGKTEQTPQTTKILHTEDTAHDPGDLDELRRGRTRGGGSAGSRMHG